MTMTPTAELQGSLFTDEPALPLANFWATEIANHIVAMATTTDAPPALFAHSRINLFGVQVMMHIGPSGRRGLLPEDWGRILSHLQEHGADAPDIAIFSFGVLHALKETPDAQ